MDDASWDLWRCCRWWGEEFEAYTFAGAWGVTLKGVDDVAEISRSKICRAPGLTTFSRKLTFFQTAQLVHRLVRPVLLGDEENIEYALDKLTAHVEKMS